MDIHIVVLSLPYSFRMRSRRRYGNVPRVPPQRKASKCEIVYLIFSLLFFVAGLVLAVTGHPTLAVVILIAVIMSCCFYAWISKIKCPYFFDPLLRCCGRRTFEERRAAEQQRIADAQQADEQRVEELFAQIPFPEAQRRVRFQPGPSNQEQPAPGPSNQEQPAPGPSNQEQPAPGPSNQEQPAPGPSNQEQPAPGPSNQEQPAPGPSNQEQPAPGPSNQEQPAPRPSNQEQPAPGPSNQEQPAPGPSNQEPLHPGQIALQPLNEELL